MWRIAFAVVLVVAGCFRSSLASEAALGEGEDRDAGARSELPRMSASEPMQALTPAPPTPDEPTPALTPEPSSPNDSSAAPGNGIDAPVADSSVPAGACRGLSTSPRWITAGDPTGSTGIISTAFGKVVAGAGDVNGDGFDDVVAGAYEYSDEVSIRGAAYLYLGDSTGDVREPAWRIEGEELSTLGCSVAGVGDVNADGFDDVVIGACGYGSQGAAFLYLGSPGGLASEPAWTALGSRQENVEGGFGRSVARAGDVNADGFDDVVIGAAHSDDGLSEAGVAFLFLGGPQGLAAEPAWHVIDGLAGDVREAFAVGLGDIDDDGFDDVGVAHDESSEVAVYGGTSDGLTAEPVWQWAFALGSQVGNALAAAGDVNGDGIDDFAVGQYLHGSIDQPTGRVFVYLGSREGVGDEWFIDGELAHSWFGASVAGVGDVNCDGFDDLLVGEPLYSQPFTPGRVSLILGGPAGLTRGASWGAPDAVGAQRMEFGTAVAAVGDTNGDGRPDAVVGSSSDGNGKLYGYFGE